MHLNAILTESENPESRSSHRRELKLSVGVQAQKSNWSSVVIHNIANEGLLLEAHNMVLKVGESIGIELPQAGIVQAEVAWVNAPFFGCRLEGSLSSAEIAAALLRSDPADDAQLRTASENTQEIGRSERVRIGPELNFASALGLAMMLWALIALVGYLIYQSGFTDSGL